MFLKRILPVLLCLPLIVVACLMSVALTVGTEPSSATAFEGLRGDLDGDGEWSAYDLALYMQYLSGSVSLSDDALVLADINCDGKADDADLLLLQQYLSGKDVNMGLRVAYVPLDNRPVNLDRAVYLATSIGIDLVMPEEHLFRTALDNMEPNPDGSTLGNREALLEWLKEVDKTCDAFVISLDQMLSGGLVGSRWLDNTDLSFEYEVIDEIAKLCENNTVILFDTVMRLASTTGYQGWNMDEYNSLRSYGQVARKQLTGSELTVENIIAGYRYNANGKEIPFGHKPETLNRYLISRERKLRIADYLLRNAGDKMESLYLGVDDSSPEITIQTNEINYLTGLLGEKGVLSAGADELGLCSLTRMATLLYGLPKVHISYYGPGKDLPADSFDIETLDKMIDTHLRFLNVSKTDDAKNALQVLTLTRSSTRSDRQALLKQAQKNLDEHIPTAILDVSLEPSELSTMLFYESDLQIGKLFGYSSWNTAGNATGVALSLGISRYAYLSSVEGSTQAANDAFLKSMTFAYIKDISYIRFHKYIDGILNEDYTCSVPLVLRRLNASKIVTSLSPYGESEHGNIKVFNFRYPWNRTFEMTFDIKIG